MDGFNQHYLLLQYVSLMGNNTAKTWNLTKNLYAELYVGPTSNTP